MDDGTLLRRFLTGALAEEEAADVELRLLADDDFFALAEAVERDVLADCARGGLAATEVEGMESVRSRLAASPGGRARLALAEDLTALARRADGPEALLARVYRLLEQSRVAATEDPQRAEEPALQALAVVDRLADEGLGAARLADLRARVWARIANSLRVRGELHGAAAAFETARDHLRQGTGDALERAHLLRLEASLLCDQRRFGEALDRLQGILPIFRHAGEDRLAVETLLGLSHVYTQAGEPDQALPILRQALDLIGPESDPWLALIVRHNLIHNAVDAGRFPEAEEMLARALPLYARFPQAWTQNRFHWLSGKVAMGRGRPAEAEALFQRARDGFLADRMPYDGALVSLDLAALYAGQGRTEELKPLARDVVAVFSSYAVHREALAAVIFLERAAAAERASFELVNRVAAFLKRSRQDPELRFADAE